MVDEETKVVDVDTETDEEKEKKAALEARKKELAKQTVQKGDMVYVDILGRTIEEDEKRNMVFQASNPEDAKLLPNYDPQKADQYTNELAIIGEKGFLLDKIDEAIVEGIKFFEEKVIQLEPEEAFGVREGKKIEKVNQKQFIKDMNGEKPYPGAIYRDKKGRSGTVLRANQGRLIVDFNHPLAGKKIEYRIKVTEKIEGFENKIKALLVRRLGGMESLKDEFKLNLDEDSKTLEIEIPQMLMFQLAQQQGGIYFKMGVAMDIHEYFKNIDTVKFSDVFPRTPAPTSSSEEHNHSHEHNHDHHIHENDQKNKNNHEDEIDKEKPEED
ncbi:FKBP-type peptidyl-prolyl cis-trans isomerase [Candidatus Harpocratesius sp.]